MANNNVQFSVLLNVGTTANVERAMEIGSAFINPDTEDRGFAIERHTDNTSVWFWSGDSGDAESVAKAAADIGKTLKLTGKWGFTYAETCDCPRLGEFGGGAITVNLKTGTMKWINAHDWLGRSGGDPYQGSTPPKNHSADLS